MSKTIGAIFENRALAYLELQGLRLLARNVNFPVGELDLVMRDTCGALVFVEVRARASAAFGGALASVTAPKRRRLRAAALRYLASNRVGPGAMKRAGCRFDVVAFEALQLIWVRDAFGACD
jgi:putative endonuclease